ncbi:MAG: universal stress protein [Myxococcota bacterium]
MNILIGTDMSDEALVASRWGFEFARRATQQGEDVELHVGHVTGAWYPQVGTEGLLDDQDSRVKLENQVQAWIAENHDDPPEYELVLAEGRSWEQLREMVEELDADWLVTGMSGQGAIARMVVGSTTHKLAHDPPCTMSIIHEKGFDWDGDLQFVAGVDFSETSKKSLELAIVMSERFGARLHIMHVVYPPGPVALPDGFVGYSGGEYQQLESVKRRAEEDMKRLLDDFEPLLERVDWTSEVITGYPTRELVAYAEDQDTDAIFMGTVGRSGLDDFILGSVASGVVKNMSSSVFLTPPVQPEM